jgi:hypothetical protein
MSSKLMSNPATLTGVWDGAFLQPGEGTITFLATLIETGGAVVGSVTEPCMIPGCPISTHNASVTGSRSGSAVSFVKRYQPPGYGYTHVFYTGTINADATEIDGHWMLANNEGSGTFLMIRSGTTAKAVTREVQSKEPTR